MVKLTIILVYHGCSVLAVCTRVPPWLLAVRCLLLCSCFLPSSHQVSPHCFHTFLSSFLYPTMFTSFLFLTPLHMSQEQDKTTFDSESYGCIMVWLEMRSWTPTDLDTCPRPFRWTPLACHIQPATIQPATLASPTALVPKYHEGGYPFIC